MDTTEQQDFVFTVSVQGHGDYPEEQLIENPKIKVEGIDDEAKKNKWEYYVNMVYEMDQFAGDLVKAVEDRGEPAVVVFYGDHLPTMGLTAEDLKSRYLYNTNYVIWDNIGLEQQDRNIPGLSANGGCDEPPGYSFWNIVQLSSAETEFQELPVRLRASPV